jgi:hypothetical protein
MKALKSILNAIERFRCIDGGARVTTEEDNELARAYEIILRVMEGK